MPKKETITIKHGPQFDGMLSTLGLFGSIGFAIVTILLFLDDELAFGATLLASLICGSLFFDFRGVSIDFTHARIRSYRSILSTRFGLWQPFKKFNAVHIAQETSFSESTTSMLTGSGRRSKHQNFHVYLKSQSDNKTLFIGEYPTREAAKITAKELAAKMDLPIVYDPKSK
jgi:hypothetical protein